jgi:hypothetical protein
MIPGALAAAGLAAGAAAAPALAAAAPPVAYLTLISARPDSGGGGNTWATDAFSERTTITPLGGNRYQAAVTDVSGTFTTRPGLAPNQGPGRAGQVITRPARGTFAGGIIIDFTASRPPAAQPPISMWRDTDPAQSASARFERAFPAGTAFGSVTVLDGWSWRYQSGAQSWTDSSASDGQGRADGQITA